MRKIINGKKYDTETAEALGYCTNDCLPRDFGYVREVLHRKKTGEFFLYGEGGPHTCYAAHCGGNSGYGEQIRPLAEAEARKWAEENLTGEEYEEIFGEVGE